jgi:diguanylate cyclase (GGDEF)-like protein
LVGKYVASLNNRLNSEQVTLIVDQARQQLANINNEVYMIKNSMYQYKVGINIISDASFSYARVLKKLYLNLLQHANLKSSLLSSQNELLTAVKSYEKQARHAAAKIQISVDGLITELLNTTVLVMIIMVGISLLLVAHFIHLHIRVPIKHIINCIEKFEAEETKQLVSLGRQDEWDMIEKSFNKMSLRLNDSYQQIRSEQDKFNYLAYHDTLTGLDNRRSILQKLVQLISEAAKENREFAIMYMDLDQFKRVNDSLGHSIGDGLLTEVARCLSLILKDFGLAARLGGDEFLVLTPNISTVCEALAFTKTINDSLSESYNLDSQNIFITNSIGICFYPKDGNDVETLIRNSDTALYYAKRSGRDCSKLYENQMTSHAHQLISQNSGIRNALENEQFVLYFQPKYNMQTGDICGAEGLIRWQHPDLGILLPIKFLPVAEETGLITDIDDWVFRHLCEQIVSWQKQGLAVDDMRFCCNFSGRQFLTNKLREKLVGIRVQTKAKPGWIEIEITEQDAMTNLTACAATMKELLDEGLELAIDDFGTGYSSLNYLKHLPATTLKIDRSFVQDMCSNRTDLAIIQSIISLAHNMDMRIIAEGIEEKNQVDRLISMGCIHGQGYYFSQPLPAPDFLDLLQNKPLLEISLSN